MYLSANGDTSLAKLIKKKKRISEGFGQVCCPQVLENNVAFAFGTSEVASGVVNDKTPTDVTVEDIDLRYGLAYQSTST